MLDTLGGKGALKQTRAVANSYSLQLQGQPGAQQAQQRGGINGHATTQPNKTAGYVDMIHRMQADNNGVKLNKGTPPTGQTSSNKAMVRPSNLLQQNATTQAAMRNGNGAYA